MIFFITADAIAIILLLIVLIVAGLGVTIAMAIKEILFLLTVGLALFSCFGGLLFLLEEVCQEELRGIKLKSIIALLLFYVFICFNFFSLPKKIDRFTEVPLNDVILLWTIPFVFVTIFSLISPRLTCIIKNKILVASLHIVQWILVIGMLVTIYWLSGAEYYYLIEKGDNGCDTSKIVVGDEDVLLYKNTKKEEEKNELLGRYSKETVLEIKKPFLGYFVEGNWARYKKVRTTSGNGSNVIGFYGKFIAPDGNVGYVAIFEGQDVDEVLKSHNPPTEAEAYKKYHPIKCPIGILLYDNLDLFHYKNYVSKTSTIISAP